MQSIGERLEEARKRKGISIREASEATKIRGEYLHKFESNQFDIRLPEIYVRGFIRTYANYLKVPADKIVSDYNGLGLGQNDSRNPRVINREVYGRMDLSVSSAKADKDSSNDTAPAIESAEKPENVAAKNPATFIPKSTGGSGSPIDRGLLIKGAGILGAIVVVILILVYALSGRGDKNATAASVPPSADVVWIRPRAGENVLTLVAVDRVQVTVREANSAAVLYQGTLPRGDRRDIPRRTGLNINTETPENLRINVGGADLELKDPSTGTLLKSAYIKPL